MDLTEFTLVFAMLWKISLGLRCYKCEAISEMNEPLCEHFDYSNIYLKECDKSSMCYKRITTSQFGTKIYERGCARQTLDGYQEKQNGRWTMVKKINEVYEEGCVESPGDEEKVTRTEHCYCRGDLCNGVADTRSNILAMEFKGVERVLSNIARMVVISVFAIGVSTLGMFILR